MKTFRKNLCSSLLVTLIIVFLFLPCVKTQAASKQSIYVLESISIYSDINGGGNISFSYNENGLVRERNGGGDLGPADDGASWWHREKYYYNSKNQISKINQDVRILHDTTFKYFYNSKGDVKKVTVMYDPEPDGKFELGSTAICKYGSKHKLVKMVNKKTNSKSKEIYSYKYSGSHVVKVIDENSGNTTEYFYDSLGNLIKDKNRNRTIECKNYYQDGRLVKRVKGKYTTIYNYKSIEIKNSMKNKVSAQQWAFINNNLNFSLGVFLGNAKPGGYPWYPDFWERY